LVFRRAVFPPGRMPGSTAGKMPATTEINAQAELFIVAALGAFAGFAHRIHG
jgi:hypothetical protein